MIQKDDRDEAPDAIQPAIVLQVREIVKLQIEQIKTRLEQKQIKITVSDAAIDHFAAAGYDIVFGARPLKRVLQNQLLDELAMKMA